MDLSSAHMSHIMAHYIGNKGNGQELVTSIQEWNIDQRNALILKNAMLEKFAALNERYSFQHPSSLDYNEVYNYCLETFAEADTFKKNAVSIAKHLYESTTHPKIKAGELYVCYFENCEINGAIVDAIGLFKAETKSNFLDVALSGNEFQFDLKEGADINKFDKGCLVLASNAEKGFDVFVYDSNRGEEAAFWKEAFLGIAPQANEYFQTNQFLNLTRQFITNQIPEEFEMERTEQIDLLNKSVEYFRANTSFDKKQFEEEVLGEHKLISSFRNFGDSYSEMNDLEFPEQFAISTQAVKKQARVFKSVLKLDKNFHIYIHGDKDLIEKGYDAAVGKHYYKIYFDEEA